MALRMTEEEFAEWQRRHQQPNSRVYTPQTLDYGAISGAVPANERPGAAQTCCQPPKRPKYGNKRVEVDGIKFDSKHEAEYYQYLMLRVRAGELKSVLRQVKFDLPGGIQYVADFVTIAPDMMIEGVYDAKSEITKQNRVYINKKKQMLACWGIEIKEV